MWNIFLWALSSENFPIYARGYHEQKLDNAYHGIMVYLFFFGGEEKQDEEEKEEEEVEVTVKVELEVDVEPINGSFPSTNTHNASLQFKLKLKLITKRFPQVFHVLEKILGNISGYIWIKLKLHWRIGLEFTGGPEE